MSNAEKPLLLQSELETVADFCRRAHGGSRAFPFSRGREEANHFLDHATQTLFPELRKDR